MGMPCPIRFMYVLRASKRPLGKVTGRLLEPDRVYSSRKIHAAGFEDAVLLSEEVRRVVLEVSGGSRGRGSRA